MKSKLTLPILLLVAGCRSQSSPDQAIRDTLSKAVAALEAGDAAGATAILDDHYQGPEGMNKAATQYWMSQILKQGKVGVHITDQDIGVNGNDAFEKVHVLFTQAGTGLLPDGSKKVYMLHWHRQGSAWRLMDVQDFTGAQAN
ncbi:MAG: hypothetical protein JST05_06055 [Acidobacteria bacterium]|nr:hypothetical protein [Acidobacteriota bacterium]